MNGHGKNVGSARGPVNAGRRLGMAGFKPAPALHRPPAIAGEMNAPFRPRPRPASPVSLEPGFSRHAEGSCLVKFGDTHVLCTASVDERVPPCLRNTGRGWVTAEYGMLPRSTHTRTDREAARGKQSGRTQEIQRLIGRVAARRGRPAGHGRATDKYRLRRPAGRRRHPHRRDHRRLGGAAFRLRAPDQGRQARGQPDDRPGRRRLVRPVGGHAGARPRLSRGFQGRRPTPTSC